MFFKKYKYILFFILSFLLITLFITILNLIFDFNNTISHVLSLLSMSILFFINGINLGKQTTNKAYKVGLIRGLIFIIILYILGGLLNTFALSIKRIIYYIILLITITLGSIIGINKRKNN